MREQLARYLNDERQGKAPDELGVHQYGSTVWLTVTRRRLVARDAPAEIDSTFIRRYQVQSTIGLPLLAGERFLGLIYLNYRDKERAPDDGRLRELERRAGTAAARIQSALEGAERTALEGLSRLTSLLTTPVGDARTNAKELRRLLSIALADLLMASNLDGAAIYQFGQQRSHLELVTAHLRVAAPARVERGDASTAWENALQKTVGEATAEADLHPVATYALGQPDDPHGYLVLLSRDHLATVRRAPSTDEMLRAGAQLIGGALASQRLIAELENSNRLLSALGDMTAAMLKPGASRHQVLHAVNGPIRCPLGRHPCAVDVDRGPGRLQQRHRVGTGACVPDRREGAKPRAGPAIHAGRRGFRARRPQGPDPRLRSVWQRPVTPGDGRPRGRLPPLGR